MPTRSQVAAAAFGLAGVAGASAATALLIRRSLAAS